MAGNWLQMLALPREQRVQTHEHMRPFSRVFPDILLSVDCESVSSLGAEAKAEAYLYVL